MSAPPNNRADTRSPANATATAGAGTSHGRGGAGNIKGASGVKVGAGDLETPTIKSSTYTTGRGGSGNMASNDPSNPTTARLAQDVEAPAHHDREPKGTFHWGRGGEGNQMTVKGKPSIANGKDKAAAEKATRTSEEEKKAEKERIAREEADALEKPQQAKLATAHGDKPEVPSQPQGSSARSAAMTERRSSFKDAMQRGKEKLGLAGAGSGKSGKPAKGVEEENAIED